MKNIKKSQAKVAVTNLGMYNEGSLSYEWLNVPCTADEFGAALKRIGVDGVRYEEYFLSDWENINGINQYSTYKSINAAATIAELITDKAEELSTTAVHSDDIADALRSVLAELVSDETDADEVADVLDDLCIYVASHFIDGRGFQCTWTAVDEYSQLLRENDDELNALVDGRFGCHFDFAEYADETIREDFTVRHYDENIIIRYYG